MARELTDKQKAAADHFVVHGRKLDAYRHGYPGINMKPNTISRHANTLFKKPHVAEYVRERRAGAVAIVEATTAHVEINAAWVLRRAALLANFNISKFVKFGENGELTYDFSTATDDDWYCMSDLKATGLTARDRMAALQLVGKHVDVQAFREQVEHSGDMTTGNYELTETERSARIAALLDRARARRTGQPDN